MKYLLSEIDKSCQDPTLKTKCKSMILDCKPGRTKWNNPNRVGQDELYQGLEKVLIDLKAYTVTLKLIYILLILNLNILALFNTISSKS